MTHDDEPKIAFTREYDSVADAREAQAGGEDRGRDANIALTGDQAERYLIHREGLPDPENVLDDDQDGPDNA